MVSKRRQVWISDELWDELEQEAQRCESTRSQLLRQGAIELLRWRERCREVEGVAVPREQP